MPGARLSGLSASVEVGGSPRRRPASPIDAALLSGTDPVGEGVLTISVGGGAGVDVTIDATNNNLNGLAKAINDKNAGVTASVVTDLNGARLVVKGQTGDANAFTLTVPAARPAGWSGSRPTR